MRDGGCRLLLSFHPTSAKRLLVTAQLLIKWGIDSSFLSI